MKKFKNRIVSKIRFAISIACSLALLVGLVVPAVSGAIVSASEPQQEGTFDTFYYTGFETGNTAKDKDGAGWAYLYSPATANYTTEKVHQGNNSLVYEFHNGWGTWKTGLPLKKGVKYTASFWYKSQKSTGNLLYCNVFTGDNEDSNKRTYVNPSTVWKQIKITFTAANDGDRFTFKFWSDTVTSYLYIDEVTIAPCMNVAAASAVSNGAAPTVSTQIKVAENQTTQFVAKFTAGEPNSGYIFERWVENNDESANPTTVAQQRVWTVTNPQTDITLKPLYIQAPTPTANLNFENPFKCNLPASVYAWYTPTIEGYDTANVYEGENSLRVKVESTARTYINDYVLTKGVKYNISFKYKTIDITKTNNDAFVTLRFGNNGTDQYINPSATWKTYTYSYTPSQDNLSLSLMFYNNPCTVYIDDLKIEVAATTQSFNMSVATAQNGTATVSKDIVSLGDSVTFTATPSSGYTLEKWVDGDGKTVAVQNPFVVASVNKDYNLTPVFITTPQAAEKLDFESVYNGKGMGSFGQAVWYTPTYSDVGGYSAQNVYNGTGSLKWKLSATSWGTYENQIDLKAGKTYNISFWYKTSDITDTNAVMFCARKSLLNNDPNVVFLNPTATWKQYKKTFTPSADDKFVIKFYQKSGFVYLDDIIVEVEDESQYVNMSVGTAANGTATVSSTKVKLGESVTFKATANSGYTLEKWVDENGKLVAVQNALVIANVDKAYNLTPVFIPMPEPTETIDFESPYNWTGKEYMGSRALWYTPTYLGAGGYSKDNVHSGEGSLRWERSTTSWDTYISGCSLKKDTSYKVTFWYKCSPDATGPMMFYGLTSAYLNDSGRKYLNAAYNWTQVSTVYTPTQDDEFGIKFYTGSGYIYLDDISIVEYEVPKIQTLDFEDSQSGNDFYSWNTDKNFTHENSKGSIKFDGINSNGALNNKWHVSASSSLATLNLNGLAFEANTEYVLTFWYYSPGATGGEMQLNPATSYILVNLKNADISWKQATIRFTVGNTDDSYAFLVGRPNTVFYVDDIVLTRIDPEGSYCQPLYNIVPNGDLEEETSDSDFADLPTWITRNEKRDELGASNGGYYLNVNASANSNNDVYYLPITLKKTGIYVFGASIKSSGNNNVKVGLVDDKDAMSISKMISGYKENMLGTTKNNGEYERVTFRFEAKSQNKMVYLAIQGNSGNVNIDAIHLFQLKYIIENDMGDYSVFEAFDYENAVYVDPLLVAKDEVSENEDLDNEDSDDEALDEELDFSDVDTNDVETEIEDDEIEDSDSNSENITTQPDAEDNDSSDVESESNFNIWVFVAIAAIAAIIIGTVIIVIIKKRKVAR